MQFPSIKDLTVALAEQTIEEVKGECWGAERIVVAFGLSNQSPSAYVEVNFANAEGDYLEDADGQISFKIRFSDHSDRYGSNLTIRIDRLISEDGEEGEVSIEPWKIDDVVGQAREAIRVFFDSLER